MAFQPAFNARLIEEVKKHQCLYNHTRRGSGDTIERMKLWDTIAKNIDNSCSGEFAKKRWLQLRDRYRKELKMAIKNNFVTPIRWCYFSQLSWLDPYLKDNIALAADGMHLDQPPLPPAPNGNEASFTWFDFSSLASLKEEQMNDDDDLESMDAPFEATSVLDRLLATANQRANSASPGMENDDSGPQSVGTSGIGGDMDDEPPPTTSDAMATDATSTGGADAANRDRDRDADGDDLDADLEMVSGGSGDGDSDTPAHKTAGDRDRFANTLSAQLANLPKAFNPLRSENAAVPSQFHESQQPAFSSQLSSMCYKEQYMIRQNRQQQQQQLLRAQLLQAGRVAMDWMNDEDLLYCRIIGLKLKKMDNKKRKKIREQIMALLEESDPENDDTCSSHSHSVRTKADDDDVDVDSAPELRAELKGADGSPERAPV